MPVQTPLTTPEGTVSVPWLYYLMQFNAEESSAGGKGGRIRTLLLKDSTVGDDIADHVTIYVPGNASRVVGVLRLPITADLTVRINKVTPPDTAVELISCTIPADTEVNTPIEFTDFANDPEPLLDGDVLIWDVTESDGQIDAAGVAAFTFEWAVS
jgi:hypothetical protein